MTRFFHRTRCLAGLLAPLTIGLLAGATPVQAQSNATGGLLGAGSSTSSGGGGQPSVTPAPRRAPALPGTRTERMDPTPPDRLPSEMAPTEALFDAINRGDMVAARDAISRGAELNGRNILGLTPIDLSVDLGRTDITFLLLSLRGSDYGGVRASPAGPGKTAQAEPKSVKNAEPKPIKNTASKATPAKAPNQISPPPPANPKLFANDGGAPVPNSGFLGFGAQR